MNIGALFIGLGLLVLILPFVSDPFRERNRKNLILIPENEQNQEMNHDQVLSALRDLDFDYQTDKIGDDDYIRIRSRLLLQASETVQERQQEDAQIEKMILTRRNTLAQTRVCPNCEKHLPADDQFCSNCGSSFSSLCPSCNHEIQPNDLFCTECGNQLKL